MKENLDLPGDWIEHTDRDWAFEARMILDELLDQLRDARLALTLFQGAKAADDPGRRAPNLYARAFIYALDTACQLIKVLKDDRQLPKTGYPHCERFLSQFPTLRDIRNSLHHVEDRLRGLGRNGKPIPTPLLLLGGWRGNNLGVTTAEGPIVEIEISDSTLEPAFAIVEDLIWCFDWLGPGLVRIHRPKETV